MGYGVGLGSLNPEPFSLAFIRGFGQCLEAVPGVALKIRFSEHSTRGVSKEGRLALKDHPHIGVPHPKPTVACRMYLLR